MKTVFLHGLGQTANDWESVSSQMLLSEIECPELFALAKNNITYSQIFSELEKRYADVTKPFRICGLSLGGILALDYTIQHENKVASLILIGVQYKIPGILIDFQNIIFRCMPNKIFKNMGISKNDMIKLAHSMRNLDFTEKINKIRCPVMIVCGEKDYANIKAAKKLKGLLPQAELHIIPNATHEINKCAPEAILDILLL